MSAVVTDAQSADIKLSDVLVTFVNQETGEATTATTSSSGAYEMSLAKGKYVVHASRDGYITVSNFIVEVQDSLLPGQGADLALSKLLNSDEWRVVLDWGAHSRDLDAHTRFGSWKHVWWSNPYVKDSSTGLIVTLDRDAREGFGPETTTITGVGKCKSTGTKCLVKYEVENYSPLDGDLGDSKARVTVYHANDIAAVYDVPKSVGSAIKFPVFTIDASVGTGVLYKGKKPEV